MHKAFGTYNPTAFKLPSSPWWFAYVETSRQWSNPLSTVECFYAGAFLAATSGKNWCFWTVVLKTLESPLDCFPGGSAVKNPLQHRRAWVQLLGWEDPLEKKCQPTLVFLPGKSHGQRILEGYSQWCQKRVRHDSRLTTATRYSNWGICGWDNKV